MYTRLKIVMIFTYPENSIFGVPLNVMLQNDRQRDPNATVPLFLEEVGLMLVQW